MNGFVGLLIAKLRGSSKLSAYLNRKIKSEQSVSMVVVQAAIPLAMKTSIGPELSELTQRQAITTGKRLSKSLNHYRADVKSVQTNASLKAIYSHHETKPNSPHVSLV